MRFRTGIVLVGLFVLLAGVVVFAIGFPSPSGTLEEQWVSDTVRDNQVNHHAVGVGPEGEVIVAPVAEVPSSDASLTNTSCSLVRLTPGNGSTVWRNGVPAEDCFTHALTESTIEDVDGDGTLEVVASSAENAMMVLDARTGREEFRVPLVSYGYGRPTVADFRPAPGKELVTSDINGNLVVASANGTVLWRTSLNKTFGRRVSVYAAPIVDDVDADGAPEVVVGSSAGTVVFSATGSVERVGDHDTTYLATGQADDDSAREVATANVNVVRVFDGASHERQWQQTMNENARLKTMADTDGDGIAELYLGLTNGTVMAIDAGRGATEWTTTVSTGDTQVLSSPILANVDGEGSPEVIAVSRDGTVAVLDADSGSELAAYERSVPIWTFPTATDIDDDRADEILVRYGDGRVVALDYSS